MESCKGIILAVESWGFLKLIVATQERDEQVVQQISTKYGAARAYIVLAGSCQTSPLLRRTAWSRGCQDDRESRAHCDLPVDPSSYGTYSVSAVLRRTNNRVELWTEEARNQRHEDVLVELTLSRHVVLEVALKLPDLDDRFPGQNGSMTSGTHMESTVDKAECTEVQVDV
jgi:hypothetical protein